MKKIVLLLLIVIILPIVIIEDTSKNYQYYADNYPDLPKDEYWEGIKQTIFNNSYNPTMKLQRHTGPVLVSLLNASSADSLVVNNAIVELKKLLPYKEIEYFENFTGLNLGTTYDELHTKVKGYHLKYIESCTIKINFNDSLKVNKNLQNKKEIETSIDRTHTYFEFKNSLIVHDVSGLWNPTISLDFKEGSDINKRKRLVEFGLMKVLACKSEFLGKFDMYEIYTESEAHLNEVRSLFKKLYIPSIFEGFKTYMYKTYPWRYTSNYLNKEKTKTYAAYISLLLVVVLLLLGFSFLYKRGFKSNYLNYLFSIVFFNITVLYGFKLYSYIAVPSGFEHWRQYISIHVLIIVVSALIALFLIFFDKYFIKKGMSFTLQLILKLGFTLFACLSPVVAIYLVENNPNSTWFKLNPLLLVVFVFTVGRGLLLYLDYFSENLVKQKDIELSLLKELNTQAEVKRLQSQINPHFLYNALNSIASLAQTDGVKTEKMALSLSDLFKYTINRKGKNKSTIKDEVEMVKNYLEVEQIRFGNRLTFNINVEKDLESIEIPMFLIQPLIENAVKHGISKIENDGEINLKIYKTDASLIIKVSDNGPHFPDGLVSGHGVQTVYDLLHLSYGEDAFISWKNTPEKEISIIINTLV